MTDAMGAGLADNPSLTALRRYADPRERIVEEFLEERLGPEGSFALQSMPLESEPSEAWVICASIGQEHGNLRRLEAIIARRLAAAGVSVLRIRPDIGPTGAMADVDLDTRLAEVVDAIALLRRGDVPVAGVVGVHSGAMVAMLACADAELESFVAIDPVRSGRQYIRESLRRQAVTDLISTPQDGGGEATSPFAELEATGATSIRGLRLSRSAYERLAVVDLLDVLRSFDGRALLVGISPTGSVSRTLESFRDHLTGLGGNVAVELVQEPLPVPLGEYYYENVGFTRIDTRLELDLQLAELTTSWVVANSLSSRAA